VWLRFTANAGKLKRLAIDVLRRLGLKVRVPEDAKRLATQSSSKPELEHVNI
jgi:hypothetical protein